MKTMDNKVAGIKRLGDIEIVGNFGADVDKEDAANDDTITKEDATKEDVARPHSATHDTIMRTLEDIMLNGNGETTQPSGILHDVEVMPEAITSNPQLPHEVKAMVGVHTDDPVEETGETGNTAFMPKEAHDTSEHLSMVDPVRVIAEIGRAKREEREAKYRKRRAGHARKMEAKRKPRNDTARASRKRNR
jgi:hypothetical protein